LLVLKTMRYHLLFFLLLMTLSSIAQNLVPNPSFEEYSPCGDPNVECKIYTSNGLNCKSSCCAATLPIYNYRINSGTYSWLSVSYFFSPFYFNECILQTAYFINKDRSWYKPRTGNAFIIINTFGKYFLDFTPPYYNDYRQYAQVRLTSALQPGCRYEVSSYVLLTPKYIRNFNREDPGIQTGMDGFGLYLAQDSIYMNDESKEFKALTDIVPQVSNPSGHFLSDSVHYQKVSGIYKALGNEQWLIIGNFKDDIHTQIDGDRSTANSAYSIDDVSVQLWKPDLISTKDTTICTTASLTLQLPDGLENYLWSTGDTSKQLTIHSGGNYTVEASNGCHMLYDTIEVRLQAPYTNPLNIGVDTFFCKVPQPYTLNAPIGYYAYKWSDNSTLNQLNVNSAGTYWLDATYACGTLRDSVIITEFNSPTVILDPSNDTTICSDQVIDIVVLNPSGYNSFVWLDGSTANHLFINQPGKYSVTATTNKNCTVKDSIVIVMIYPPMIHDFPDTLACEETTLDLKISPNIGEEVLWFDGKINNSHSFNNSGTYWVKLSNSCYTSIDSLAIDFQDCSLNIPNLITNNNDGKNDFFVIETKIDRPLVLSIYNSWGTEIFKDENYRGQWGGSNLKDGIYFYYITDALLKKSYKGWLQVVN